MRFPWAWLRPAPLLLAASIAIGSVLLGMQGVRWWQVRQLQSQVRELERQKEELLAYAKRLTATRRVAQIDVLRQSRVGSAPVTTDLLWRAIADEGMLDPGRLITIAGTLGYFEAAVIKFEFETPQAGQAPQRTSLALFRRVFGDEQTPASGIDLDRDAPRSLISPSAADADANLWDMFWRFIEEPQLAKQYAVRVAQIEAPAVPLKEGDVWEVTLDAAGGLNLRKIGKRDTTAWTQRDAAFARTPAESP